MLEELRRYLFTGGMFEAVSAYSHSGKMREAFEVQAELANAYRQDFAPAVGDLSEFPKQKLFFLPFYYA